jgi:hypothetical protein
MSRFMKRELCEFLQLFRFMKRRLCFLVTDCCFMGLEVRFMNLLFFFIDWMVCSMRLAGAVGGVKEGNYGVCSWVEGENRMIMVGFWLVYMVLMTAVWGGWMMKLFIGGMKVMD